MSSWVKVSRKLLTSAIASKPEYLAVWMHLILSASYKPGEVLVGHQVVKLNAGQLVFGRIKFAQQIGVSEHTLRMALKSLETLQQITIKSESKFSVITITNWAKYQTDSPADHQQATSKPPASHHNKEVLELQEEDQKPLSSGEPNDEPGKRERKKDETPYAGFLKTYQELCAGHFKPAEVLNDKRRAAIKRAWNFKARDSYPFRKDGFLEIYLGKCLQDQFLSGSNNRGWRADLEYVFREKTMTDVIGV